MTLSTSNSDLLTPPISPTPRRRRPRRRRELACTLLAVGVFLALAVAGAILVRRPAYAPNLPLAAVAKPPRSSDHYLSYYRAGIDEYVVYHNLHNAADALRQADVLFLGNSTVMFTFGQDTLEPFFKKLNLRYYVMAFPYGEPSPFAEAIIEKYDLHPRWVIINAAPFFARRPSPFATKVMSETPWDAWKFAFEANATFAVRHRLHQFVPYLDPRRLTRNWIMFRSLQDGTTRVAAARTEPSPVRYNRKSRLAQASDNSLRIARRLVAQLQARGAKVVLTSVPPFSPNYALDYGEALHLPVIIPQVRRLTTLDGNHLSDASANRFSKAFLAQLERHMNGEPIPTPPRLTTRPVEDPDQVDPGE